MAAARAGDGSAFAALAERYRAELRVHCYRMLGSFDESEDMVQETFLRAWKGLPGFEGRSTVRAWLYRIATNACLNVLDGRGRRVLPDHLEPPSDPARGRPPRTDITWLQPFPDQLWEPAAPSGDEPDAVVVARETIELAFLAAIQNLPPRQRAVLILRDVLGWPARQIAELLDGSVASVNSASQRARATLREHLPGHRLEWASAAEPTEQERVVLRRYMDAVERADLAAMAGLLAKEVRTTMPPYPTWFAGRDAVLGALAAGWDPAAPGYVGRFRMLPVGAGWRRRCCVPALRDRRAAGCGRPHYRGHRLPRPRPVPRVRAAFGAAAARPVTFPVTAVLTGVNRIELNGGSHGEAAVLGHYVTGRLHRRPRRGHVLGGRAFRA